LASLDWVQHTQSKEFYDESALHFGDWTSVGSPPAFAHHPFNSEFDANAPVHLTGKVTQINWSNPRVLIFMTATAANGDQIWTLEAANPTELSRKGWSQNTLKTGDQIKVDGYRGKANQMTVAARAIELPDGKKLSAADDEDGGPKSPPAP
jgi:Family of unknown function (DUF6152)